MAAFSLHQQNAGQSGKHQLFGFSGHKSADSCFRELFCQVRHASGLATEPINADSLALAPISGYGGRPRKSAFQSAAAGMGGRPDPLHMFRPSRAPFGLMWLGQILEPSLLYRETEAQRGERLHHRLPKTGGARDPLCC